MKATTREWIEKAEADFVSAGREYRARHRPNFDAACFFSQQCIEKYLKGRYGLRCDFAGAELAGLRTTGITAPPRDERNI